MIELVWDAEQSGTALTSSGSCAVVGERAQFSPEDLVCMGVASCLMRTVVQRTDEAGIPILSYAATAQVTSPDGEAPRITVHGYVVASSGAAPHTVDHLCRSSVAHSPVARLLGDRLTATWDVRVLNAPHATVH